jgi:hypothetical protein
MTDWHCSQCRRRVTLYHHVAFIICTGCDRDMARGRGKGTSHDAYQPVRVGRKVKSAADAEAESARWRP